MHEFVCGVSADEELLTNEQVSTPYNNGNMAEYVNISGIIIIIIIIYYELDLVFIIICWTLRIIINKLMGLRNI